MTYKIEFAKTIEKQLSDIPSADQKKIAKRIEKLSVNPFPQEVDKLKGSDDLYRIRQGS